MTRHTLTSAVLSALPHPGVRPAASIPRHGRAVRQRGAALLMAMVIVTLVATFAASMVWQQWRAVQVEGAERVRAQSSAPASTQVAWARLILREDGRNGGSDHLGEPWAIPLAEARLSTFLAVDGDNSTVDADAPEAFLSGSVDDAASRYNLRNLVNSDGDVVPEELLVLKRLCENAGQSPALADGLAQSMRQATLAIMALQSQDAQILGKLGGEDGLRKAPIMPQSADQLLWLGLDAGTLERLRPYMTVLPDPTQVNVNTAPKEVIAAVIDGLDLARAARIVQTRQRNPFKGTEELRAVLGAGNWNFSRIAVKSDYFEIRGRLRLDDNVIEQRHLVNRPTPNDVVVKYQGRFSGVELGANPSPNP
jgi:general secretion pathway protein K